MQTDAIIIGGGLSGLVAAWQLQRAGVHASLLEARTRFGGRVLTVARDVGADCDLGPSWFWPGQPLVAALLNHFQIPHYGQFADGTVLFQRADGCAVRIPDPSPMKGARRIEGGVGRLVEAIVAELHPASCFPAHVATGLSAGEDGIIVDVRGSAGARQIQAKHAAVALPPRLAAALAFAPALPAETRETLAATPTWMAGHAKFFARYDRPFWREKGLCGSAFSQRGPLAEIHDATPNAGPMGCLFGFVGLDAERRAKVGQADLAAQATLQLGLLFGDEAKRPVEVFYQDWSLEEFTASQTDRRPQIRHPQYGLDLWLGSAWDERLAFISSETSFNNGGLIEGALESGLRFAARITGHNLPLDDAMEISHQASMGWDWL